MSRRKFEVQTIGSRDTRDLRPILSDDLPQGFNMRVCSYNEVNNTCIVEIWCSNHEVLPSQHQKTEEDLKTFDSRPSVLKVLPNSPKVPEILGRVFVNDQYQGLEKVIRATKKLVIHGKEIAYLRSQKVKDTKGRDRERFLVDEG